MFAIGVCAAAGVTALTVAAVGIYRSTKNTTSSLPSPSSSSPSTAILTPIPSTTPVKVEFHSTIIDTAPSSDTWAEMTGPPFYTAQDAAKFLNSGYRVWDCSGRELKLLGWDSDEVAYMEGVEPVDLIFLMQAREFVGRDVARGNDQMMRQCGGW